MIYDLQLHPIYNLIMKFFSLIAQISLIITFYVILLYLKIFIKQLKQILNSFIHVRGK